VAADAPSRSVTARVAAGRVWKLQARRGLPIATDWCAEPGEAAFEQPGAGANAM
jgi:hypothetical protein